MVSTNEVVKSSKMHMKISNFDFYLHVMEGAISQVHRWRRHSTQCASLLINEPSVYPLYLEHTTTQSHLVMMQLMGNHLSLNSLLPECGGSDGASHARTRPACTLTVPPLNWWIRHHRNITRTPDSRWCKTLCLNSSEDHRALRLSVLVYGGSVLVLSCSTTSAWWNHLIQEFPKL